MKPKYLTKYSKFRTANLFLETANRDVLYEDDSGAMPVFTLSPEDVTDINGNKFISMHKLFLKADDITGYDFAMDVLGSYDHYVKLTEHHIIGPYIQCWVEEVKARLDSKAIKEINRIAKEGGSQVELSAAKYLANREYESVAKVGRPATNNRARKKVTEEKAVAADTKNEMERLGITH